MKCCFYKAGGRRKVNDNIYRVSEIKYNIDTAIQKSMFENDEDKWNIILEMQGRLYEAFGISD